MSSPPSENSNTFEEETPRGSRRRQQQHGSSSRGRQERSKCPCGCCGCCDSCTCCGTCPRGCTTWLANLNRVWLAFFLIMNCTAIVWFAGAGATLFETTDGRRLWSSWYKCVDADVVNSTTGEKVTSTTTSATTSTVLGIVVGRTLSCQTTYLESGIWPCEAVETRMLQLGGLLVSGWVFAVLCVLLSIGHLAFRWRLPVLPMLLCILVVTEGIGVCALTQDMWSGTPLCQGTTFTGNDTSKYYVLFNATLSGISDLQMGTSYPAMIVATLLACFALVTLFFLCCFPDGPPKDKLQEQRQRNQQQQQQQQSQQARSGENGDVNEEEGGQQQPQEGELDDQDPEPDADHDQQQDQLHPPPPQLHFGGRHFQYQQQLQQQQQQQRAGSSTGVSIRTDDGGEDEMQENE